MSKYKYTEDELQLNRILKFQDDELKSIKLKDSAIDKNIKDSEELLKSLGYDLSKIESSKVNDKKKVAILPNWDDLCYEANNYVKGDCELESIFTEKEIFSNEEAIKKLNRDYKELNKLDKNDIAICASAALLGAAMDILLVGIPQKTSNGLKAGKLSDYIRDYFDKIFPADEMNKLANSKVSKVPYDAQDNRNTKIRVEGLSAYYHRLLSLGHDPLLGLFVGVHDILTGKMTTIDKNGKFVSQVMDCYANRSEQDIFKAIAKQIIHFKTDVTTSMGLPAPLMGLFNLLQFGSIGEEEQTIAEIVQGMYFEGYDFIHFCSQSIPVMVIEVFVRLAYSIKVLKVKKFKDDNCNKYKLNTMLFIAHSGATAVNAGKVYFNKNPMEINYPQWLAFAKYSFSILKQELISKPHKRELYVDEKITSNFYETIEEIDKSLEDYIVIMD